MDEKPFLVSMADQLNAHFRDAKESFLEMRRMLFLLSPEHRQEVICRFEPVERFMFFVMAEELDDQEMIELLAEAE